MKEKRTSIHDPNLSLPVGKNCSMLPPNVEVVPSSSKPGQYSFLDVAMQTKYASAGLVWEVFFRREFMGDSPGQESAPVGYVRKCSRRLF